MHTYEVTRIYWKKNAIGIKLAMITPTDFRFEVTACNKTGKRYYPYQYIIKSKADLLNKGYEIDTYKGVKLIYIPVDDLSDYVDQAETAKAIFNH